MQISGQKKKKKDKDKEKGGSRLGMSAVGQSGAVPAPSGCTAPATRLEYTSTAGKIEVIQPGCLVIRGIIPIPVQQRMLDECFEKGKAPEGVEMGSAGFFEPISEDGRLRLNQGNRGRLIHPSEDFSTGMTDACKKWSAMANEFDPSIPLMDPTTILVNFYNKKGTFKWHRDTEDPKLVREGRGKPIVSVSIGESCDFGIKDDYDDENFKTVRLDSGDVLLFGGPARMIVHSVLSIVPNTRPPSLRFPYQPGRLNITFREVDGVVDTSMFPAYRVIYDIEED